MHRSDTISNDSWDNSSGYLACSPIPPYDDSWHSPTNQSTERQKTMAGPDVHPTSTENNGHTQHKKMSSKEDELNNLITKDTDNGVHCDSQSLKRSSDNASKVSVEENINDPTMTVHVTTNTMSYDMPDILNMSFSPHVSAIQSQAPQASLEPANSSDTYKTGIQKTQNETVVLEDEGLVQATMSKSPQRKLTRQKDKTKKEILQDTLINAWKECDYMHKDIQRLKVELEKLKVPLPIIANNSHESVPLAIILQIPPMKVTVLDVGKRLYMKEWHAREKLVQRNRQDWCQLFKKMIVDLNLDKSILEDKLFKATKCR